MGVVNVVPVSSGTIALVLGVFERFINSIKSLNPKNFKCLFKGEVTEFGRRTDFRFLVTILLGIIVGMVFTAIFLKRVLKSYEVFVWAFFIGLIIASVINVMKSIEKVTVKKRITEIVKVPPLKPDTVFVPKPAPAPAAKKCCLTCCCEN